MAVWFPISCAGSRLWCRPISVPFMGSQCCNQLNPVRGDKASDVSVNGPNGLKAVEVVSYLLITSFSLVTGRTRANVVLNN